MGMAVTRVDYEVVESLLGLGGRARIVCVAPVDGSRLGQRNLMLLLESDELTETRKEGEPYPEVSMLYEREGDMSKGVFRGFREESGE